MGRLPFIAGFAAAALAWGAAASAQEAASGRFQIAPGEGGGFVRLDTRTGAVSHCAKRDNAWFCEPLPGADSDLDAKVSALSAEVVRLTRELTRLSTEVQALRSGAPPAVVAEPKVDDETAIGFAERVMQRFFDLVREMKRDDPGRS